MSDTLIITLPQKKYFGSVKKDELAMQRHLFSRYSRGQNKLIFRFLGQFLVRKTHLHGHSVLFLIIESNAAVHDAKLRH